MKTRIILFNLILILCFTCSCAEEESEKEETTGSSTASSIIDSEPINVVVVLDLSNRINPELNPFQSDKDQVVIRSILKVFEERQKKFNYLISKDKLTIACANQANPSFKSFDFIDGMSIDMGDHMKRPVFDQLKMRMLHKCETLYKQAVIDANSGADIYTWFKDELPGYLEEGEYKNKVIVLTDGYLCFDASVAKQRPEGTQITQKQLNTLRSHQATWLEKYQDQNMSFKPHKGVVFSNTEVSLLEVKPRFNDKYIHEMSFITHFWIDWLNKMNIQARVEACFSNRVMLEKNLKQIIND